MQPHLAAPRASLTLQSHPGRLGCSEPGQATSQEPLRQLHTTGPRWPCAPQQALPLSTAPASPLARQVAATQLSSTAEGHCSWRCHVVARAAAELQ